MALNPGVWVSEGETTDDNFIFPPGTTVGVNTRTPSFYPLILSMSHFLFSKLLNLSTRPRTKFGLPNSSKTLDNLATPTPSSKIWLEQIRPSFGKPFLTSSTGDMVLKSRRVPAMLLSICSCPSSARLRNTLKISRCSIGQFMPPSRNSN